MTTKLKVLLFVLLLLSVIFSSALTKEQEPKNLLIIIDSSRSMLQLTRDGKEKLWSAKQALDKLIDKIPDETNVALMVFGHRSQYGCEDIEIVLPLQPLNRVTIRKKLELLKPTGVTPLMASLDKAAEHLKKFEGKSTILLLTDGKETCAGDPVNLVADISTKYGIMVIVDVVGLDVKMAERQQLEAIARAGGGKYYSANTSYELISAVNDAVEPRLIEIQPQKEKEQTDTAIKDAGFGTLLINHRYILNSIAIYDEYTNERADGQVMWAHSKNQYSTHLKPGLYRIEVYSSSNDRLTEIENVRIRRNKKTTINVN